jgi:hypothetical protein
MPAVLRLAVQPTFEAVQSPTVRLSVPFALVLLVLLHLTRGAGELGGRADLEELADGPAEGAVLEHLEVDGAALLRRGPGVVALSRGCGARRADQRDGQSAGQKRGESEAADGNGVAH